MEDFVQDDLNVTLNTVTQTILDVTADYLLSSQVLGRINNDLKINLNTSVFFHIIDEVVFKAVMDKMREYIRDVPMIGNWLSKKIYDVERRPYIKALIQIITILMIQKFTSEPDVVELCVIMLNTYMIDYVAEIPVISDVLDTKFDF